MPEFDTRPSRNRAPGDRYMQSLEDEMTGKEDEKPSHQLDGQEARDTHRRLLSWFFLERDRQAENRLEMAMDHDFYDGIQWDPADAQILRDRGQMPLVYNEVATIVDWVIGTERRTRVDWKVLPRTEDDVEASGIKTKVLKFVSDVNRVQYARSRAFADAAKGGVGWVDDGARDDPTQDILYSKYEDWRNVLWDSQSYELDLSDARYLFRWRWVDEDVALMMFPDRHDAIRRAVEEQGAAWWDSEQDQTWYLGENLEKTGQIMAGGTASIADVNTRRRRVKLIECQYRMPVKVKIVSGGPFKGAFLPTQDTLLGSLVEAEDESELVDKVAMRVHMAVFTESDMLSMGPSPYRHNQFSLTPFWAYRRSRDRLPYGMVRRVRDIQQDMNKRASKALFMLNTNQIIANKGAVDDPNKARDEVDRPDGYVETVPGKEFVIRRDTDAATGQINMMTLAAQSIQKIAGVNNENLGRQTNAVSGAAIEARQNQGAVSTTEVFDNARFAVQIQGEKQLSMAEQFYTAPRVVRLTGDQRGALDWVRVNQPEVDPETGEIRFINDITARMADFVVSEADYAGTLRQVMFDSLNQLAGRLDPNVALRIFTIAMEYSDLPNKDAIVDAIRAVTGDRDPNKEPTPEEAAADQVKQQQQMESIALQRQMALEALEEQRAKVREINAKAAEIEARVQSGGNGLGGGWPTDEERMLMRARSESANQIDAMATQLASLQAELSNRTLQIGSEADTKVAVAHIEAASRERVAEIQAATKQRLDAIEARLDKLLRMENKEDQSEQGADDPRA